MPEQSRFGSVWAEVAITESSHVPEPCPRVCPSEQGWSEWRNELGWPGASGGEALVGTGSALGLCPAHAEVQRLVLRHKSIYELQALLSLPPSLNLPLMCPEGGGLMMVVALTPVMVMGHCWATGRELWRCWTCSASTPPLAGTGAGAAAVGAAVTWAQDSDVPGPSVRDGPLCCSGVTAAGSIAWLSLSLSPRTQPGALGRQEGTT